jgi:hypothetical protein
MDHFWETGPGFDAVRISIKPPPVPLPALRRLGRPNFVTEDLPRLLTPAYEAISRSALETALAEEEGSSVADVATQKPHHHRQVRPALGDQLKYHLVEVVAMIPTVSLTHVDAPGVFVDIVVAFAVVLPNST